jgi:hypothetical protein
VNGIMLKTQFLVHLPSADRALAALARGTLGPLIRISPRHRIEWHW